MSESAMPQPAPRGAWWPRWTPVMPRNAGSTSRWPGGVRFRPMPSSPTTSRCSDDRLRRLTTTWPPASASRRCGLCRSSSDRKARADEDEAVLDGAHLAFGPPILRPPSLRDFYAFERHVGTMWARRGGEIPEAWFRLPIFYFSNVSEIRGPGDPVWAPRGSSELDYELEVAALVDTPARDLAADGAEAVIGGYLILNDWSARDLQREETTVRLGPAKGKDFATSIGPWLVTPDELADRRSATGFDLSMTATVNGVETSRGTWSSIHFSFGQMLQRASADVQLRPGDLLGSGTVGGGCLLEIREETIGRYLKPRRRRGPSDRTPG